MKTKRSVAIQKARNQYEEALKEAAIIFNNSVKSINEYYDADYIGQKYTKPKCDCCK
jgi:hypothetical protein